jgi:NAD(P)-dependent dehydrogenase (short-subunit alcohol dehydrogenase family)
MNQFWNKKRVLITGGTSGLGLELAKLARERGALVATVARGTHAHVADIRGDVGEKEQLHAIHTEAVRRLGGIDVLINNASDLGPTPLKLLVDTDCEDLDRVLNTNLFGPFRLTKLALAGMLLNQFGVVVNISSDAAVSAYPRWGAYGVSKAALDHLTRIFQAELADSGVRFLALDPGDMRTPLHFAAIPDADPKQLHDPKESARLILDQIAAEKFEPVRRSIR